MIKKVKYLITMCVHLQEEPYILVHGNIKSWWNLLCFCWEMVYSFSILWYQTKTIRELVIGYVGLINEWIMESTGRFKHWKGSAWVQVTSPENRDLSQTWVLHQWPHTYYVNNQLKNVERFTHIMFNMNTWSDMMKKIIIQVASCSPKCILPMQTVACS